MALEQPVLLKRIPTRPWGDPSERKVVTYDAYVAQEGYQALDKAVGMGHEAIVNEVKASELRGRGGAGFPTGLKFSFMPPLDGGHRYFCVNADESEPATFKDQLLIRADPHSIIEGICIAMLATQTDTTYFYIRGEYHEHREVFEHALREAYDNKILGDGSRMGQVNERWPNIYLVRGAGAYICGEETALMNSVEGIRGWPRIKPPFPAVAGVFKRPTTINNVESIANLPYIILHGADQWKKNGKPRPEGAPPQVPASYGTKLMGVSGPVKRPGVYEENLGVKLLDVVDGLAGGVVEGRKIKAYFHGGISMGVVSQEEALQGVELDFDIGKKWANLGLGTACITVIPEDVSMVAMARNCARFYAHESCGQCTPCREGGTWMAKILHRIEAGDGTTKDLDLLLEIAASMGMMPGTTICGLADGANWAVRTILNKFWHEFEAKVRKQRYVSLAVVGSR